MTIVAEVRDAIRTLSELVEQTRTILAAIKDGQAYLRKNHPDAKGRLAELLEQMRITISGLVTATRVLTDFDFTVDGTDVDREPARFNNQLIDARKQIGDLEADISRLKGSCTRIERLTQELDKRADNRPWWALLGDRAGQTAWQLAGILHQLYGTDEEMIRSIERTLRASESALDAVRDALREATGASISNVRAAAQVLHEQADGFRPIERQLKQLRNDLGDQIAALD